MNECQLFTAFNTSVFKSYENDRFTR